MAKPKEYKLTGKNRVASLEYSYNKGEIIDAAAYAALSKRHQEYFVVHEAAMKDPESTEPGEKDIANNDDADTAAGAPPQAETPAAAQPDVKDAPGKKSRMKKKK